MGRGKPFPKGVSGNPKGRPVGAADRIRRSAIRAAYEDLFRHCDGEAQMLRALEAGIRAGGKLALGYLELGARLLDGAGRPQRTQIIFNSPLNPQSLRVSLGDGDRPGTAPGEPEVRAVGADPRRMSDAGDA